jgi:hypothetical protein
MYARFTLAVNFNLQPYNIYRRRYTPLFIILFLGASKLAGRKMSKKVKRESSYAGCQGNLTCYSQAVRPRRSFRSASS